MAQYTGNTRALAFVQKRAFNDVFVYSSQFNIF